MPKNYLRHFSLDGFTLRASEYLLNTLTSPYKVKWRRFCLFFLSCKNCDSYPEVKLRYLKKVRVFRKTFETG